MGALASGAVVLLPFPFSDLSRSKLRPAVILANAGKGDWIACQITSNPYGDPLALTLDESMFTQGSLQRLSFVRPGKLFTAHESLFSHVAGHLAPPRHADIVAAVIRLLHNVPLNPN